MADIRQRLTVEVTTFDRHGYFRDAMTAGAFRSFAHDHRFEARDCRTTMTDDVEFRSPLGPLGWLVDRFFLIGYRILNEGIRRGLLTQLEKQAGDAALQWKYGCWTVEQKGDSQIRNCSELSPGSGSIALRAVGEWQQALLEKVLAELLNIPIWRATGGHPPLGCVAVN